MKLINKSALVAEIERRKKYYENIQMIKPVYENNIEDFNELLSFLDTLEVKEVQEEPVSNNYSALLPCIYNRTLEERVKYCKYCSAACEGRVKEPVSEDLEEAVNAYIGYAPEVDESSSTYGKRQAFKAGAKWQKEKDAILPKVWNRKNLDDFSYQTAYDLSNDWAKETPTWDDVEKACKLGSEWQKKQDQKSMEIMDEVYFKSCDMIRKQIINKACDWLNTNDSYATPTNVKVEELKKYLEE